MKNRKFNGIVKVVTGRERGIADNEREKLYFRLCVRARVCVFFFFFLFRSRWNEARFHFYPGKNFTFKQVSFIVIFNATSASLRESLHPCFFFFLDKNIVCDPLS